MRNTLFVLYIVLGWVVIPVNKVCATELVHYSNIPFTIELRVGEERSIQFGDHVQVGVTKAQQFQNLFRVQAAQGAVHFLPYKTFDKQRVQIKRLTDGKVILLDLIAFDSTKGLPPLENMRVILESENVTDGSVAEPTREVAISPVEMTRYVAQRLYGPTRLHKDLVGLSESTLGVEGLIRLFKGENKYQTISRPIIAFKTSGYYIAGIYIRNIASVPLQLDYLDINVPFSHATFQHHRLGPTGEPGDNTVLYLITEQPLKEALYPWTYYHDLQAEAAEARLREQQEKKRSRNHKHHKN